MKTVKTLVKYIGSEKNNEDQPAKQGVIWLHGLGATNQDFVALLPHLGLNPQKKIKFIFPQAPNREVTANGYMSMPAWYDIRGWDFQGNRTNFDFEGMQASIQQMHGLIQQEIEGGILAHNLIIGGFSQGGATGLLSALTCPHSLAGAFGLSCYLPNLDKFTIQRPLKTTQFFMAHGTFDPVVPYPLGEAAKKQLTEVLGASTEWHGYPIEHTINITEGKALGSWLNARLID